MILYILDMTGGMDFLEKLYFVRLKTFRRFLSPKKGRNLAISRQIWFNFEFKKVIYWLGHSVPIKSSTANAIVYFYKENTYMQTVCIQVFFHRINTKSKTVST